MGILHGLAAAWMAALTAGDPYLSGIETWRRAQEERLNTEGGWLAVSGLFWLRPGENTIGSAPSNRIILPAGRAPARLGSITWRDGKVVFRTAGRLTASLNGKPDLRMAELIADRNGTPDVVDIPPDLSFFVTCRGDRLAVEVRDRQCPLRRSFKGLRWYPVNQEWRFQAKFFPYAQDRKILFPTAEGDVQEMLSPGYVEFQAAGKPLRLTPVRAGDSLLFIFQDTTAGAATHPHSRFLYADMPRRGELTLDFNKAQNPPHAFTPYAACPLPPPENRLDIAVEAGERIYGGN